MMAGTAWTGRGAKSALREPEFVGLRVPRFTTAQHGGHNRYYVIDHKIDVITAEKLDDTISS